MEYRKLGNTDIDVSVICLGTMTFGQQNTEKEGHEQLDYALDNGVNFIDTAELYAVPSNPKVQGKTEEIIGTWIQKSKKRDKFILASKATGPSPNLGFIRPNIDFSKTQIRQALEGSLRRLQTDFIDLYQLHWPERKANFFGKLGYEHDENDEWKDNVMDINETMVELVKEGKIGHYGLSNETPWGVMRHLNEGRKSDGILPVSIQNPYSLLNRSFEVGLAEIAIRENIGLLAYSPMAFGLLSGKYHKNQDKPENRINQFKQLSRYSSENAYNIAAKYIQIADNAGLSPAQMALSFVNSRPFLTSNIIGATTMDQLKENIDSINVNLSSDVLEAIENVHILNSNPCP